MSPEMIAVLAVILLIGLLLIRVPVGFSLLVAGGVGLLVLDGFELATRTLASEPYNATSRYTLVVIPMFILMGMFAMESGVAVGAFRLANKVAGRLPGGLGIATVLVCAVFAAVSGSSPATVATVGRIAIPEMRKAGYTREFTAGIVGTAGTLGVLIPPSIVAVLFGVVTEVSIGRLLIAGILPGVLSVLVLSGYIIVRAVRSPELISDRSYVEGVGMDLDLLEPHAGRKGLRAGSTGASAAPVGVAVKARATDLYSLVGVAVMFVVVIGGIYSGFFTATESAAFGALVGVGILVVSKLGKRGFAPAFLRALRETASTSTMIFVIIIGAAVFTSFMVRSGVTRTVSDAILGLGLSPTMLALGTLLLMLPLGMFLEATSIIVITMPILWPVLSAAGVDGIWFGIMVIVMIEIGLITPPVGINGFVLAGIAEDISLERTFRGLAPFVVVQLVIVAILFAVPSISTALPALMRS